MLNYCTDSFMFIGDCFINSCVLSVEYTVVYSLKFNAREQARTMDWRSKK